MLAESPAGDGASTVLEGVGTSLDAEAMVYIGRSSLTLSVPADDVRGMVVVDPNGHRVGEVDDLLIDPREGRVRLLSVVSGGLLGLAPREHLIPVETIAKVDDRVHLDTTWSTAALVSLRD